MSTSRTENGMMLHTAYRKDRSTINCCSLTITRTANWQHQHDALFRAREAFAQKAPAAFRSNHADGQEVKILVVFFYARLEPGAAELLTFHMAAEKTLCALAF